MKRFLSLTFSFLAPVAALAQFGETPGAPSLDTVNPQQGPVLVADWFSIVQDIVGWLFAFAVVIGVGALIVAGIMYITAGGSQERISKAVSIMIYAIIGVAVAALAWALVNLATTFFVGTTVI